jgi:hypothetical protein
MAGKNVKASQSSSAVTQEFSPGIIGAVGLWLVVGFLFHFALSLVVFDRKWSYEYIAF